ncbi:MAG: DNA-3-methyladenine glycosylase [Candidatus Dormibacteria bacterium]
MRRRAAPLTPTLSLSRSWFARDTMTVARELIGCALVVDGASDELVTARIVETEAYLGTADPASHAFRGPTPRAAIMFGEAAHLYVYLSYGVHHCANMVTERNGVAGAVLLRSAVVEEGEDTVRRRRGARPERIALLRGPGNLCRGLGISLMDNGADLCAGESRFDVQRAHDAPSVSVATRVGITAAAQELRRFAWTGHPAVSPPAPWKTMRGRASSSPL